MAETNAVPTTGDAGDVGVEMIDIIAKDEVFREAFLPNEGGIKRAEVEGSVTIGIHRLSSDDMQSHINVKVKPKMSKFKWKVTNHSLPHQWTTAHFLLTFSFSLYILYAFLFPL
jgi:hypothetical protein